MKDTYFDNEGPWGLAQGMADSLLIQVAVTVVSLLIGVVVGFFVDSLREFVSFRRRRIQLGANVVDLYTVLLTGMREADLRGLNAVSPERYDLRESWDNLLLRDHEILTEDIVQHAANAQRAFERVIFKVVDETNQRAVVELVGDLLTELRELLKTLGYRRFTLRSLMKRRRKMLKSLRSILRDRLPVYGVSKTKFSIQVRTRLSTT